MTVQVVDQDDHSSVALVRGTGVDVELFVRSTGFIEPTATMWLPLTLPVAMRLGRDLHIKGSVDRRALDGAVRAQETLVRWWPQWLKSVDVTVDQATSSPESSDGIGLAFSGGVDAFHSLLKHRDEVSHLWFVHGFDVPLWRTDLRSAITRHLSSVAEATGQELVEVVTNVKPWADRFTRWSETYVGPATAGIALGHSPMWGSSLIASSGAGERQAKWSTHPDLDPLWSSGSVDIVNDQSHVERVQKVRDIASWDVAMKHLRVCWMNPHQAYNCGRCEKCSRTIVNFIAADAYGRPCTLPADPALPLPPIVGAEAQNHWHQNLSGLRALRQRRPDLEAAIADAMTRGVRSTRLVPIRRVARRALAFLRRVPRPSVARR